MKKTRYDKDFLQKNKHILSVLNNLPDGVYLKDENSRFITANQNFAELLALKSINEIYGKTDYDYFPEEAANNSLEEDKKILKLQEKKIISERTLKHKGETKYIRTIKLPLKGENNHVIGIIGIDRDITDQKLVEIELTEQNQKLEEERYLIKALMDNIPDIIYIKDTEGRFLGCNQRQVKITKAGKEENMIGKTDYDFYPREIADIFFKDDMDIIKTGKPVINKEEIGFDDKGNEVVRSTTKVPFKDNDGNIIGLVGIGRNITKQKEFEKKLIEQTESLKQINVLLEERQEEINQQSEELSTQNKILEDERNLLRTLIDNIPNIVYIKDKKSRFITVNSDHLKRLKVKNLEDVIGKTDYDFYPKQYAENYFRDEQEILKTGVPILGKEETSLNEKGEVIYTLTTKVPYYDSDGNMLGIVGIGSDITSLKEAEIKLKEQADNLKESNQLLEERQEEIESQSEEIKKQNELLEREKNLLQTLIDSMPDYIYIKDAQSKFIVANKYQLETFNFDTTDEIIGKTDYDFYPKNVADAFYKDEKHIVKTGEAIVNKIETSGIDEKGIERYISTTKMPFRDGRGKIIGIVGIGRDITDQIQNEKKLIEQSESLKEVNVLLEERQEEINQQSEEIGRKNEILEFERNQLRTLIDNMPDLIYIKDTESRFVTVNKRTIEMLKAESLEDVIGKTDFNFYPKEYAQSYFDDEQNIINTGKSIIGKEEPGVNEKGEMIYLLTSKVPIKDPDGKISGIVGIGRDITDKKEDEIKLHEQAKTLKEINVLLEERQEEIQQQTEELSARNTDLENEKNLLRTFIDNMPDFIYIKDAQSRFITANRHQLEVFHVDSLEDIIGKTDYDFHPKENADVYYKDERNIIKSGKPIINKEEKGLDTEGNERYISTTKVPFKDVDGKVIGIVGIGRDITKQKNAEKKLTMQAENLREINVVLEERQEKIQLQSEKLNEQAEILKGANKQLEELNATKNKFFSIIAHDLKNPFQAIFGFSELLIRNFNDFDTSQKVDLLNMIKNSSESAFNLLENLLQWARTQTDRINYNPATINLFDLVKQNIELSTPTAENKNIKLTSNVHENCTVFADKNMINTVIRNLVSNAIKFTPSGGEVSIICDQTDKESVQISISDTGIGISDENIKKLFRIDEYFSTSGTSGEAGTGLGLIICKEFVEKNGGKIKIDSKINKGTTFSFSLPVKEKKS